MRQDAEHGAAHAERTRGLQGVLERRRRPGRTAAPQPRRPPARPWAAQPELVTQPGAWSTVWSMSPWEARAASCGAAQAVDSGGRAARALRTGTMCFIAGWKLGANMKAMPASLIHRSMPAAGSARSTPSVSSTSAEPHLQRCRGAECRGAGGAAGAAGGQRVRRVQRAQRAQRVRRAQRARRVREGAGRAHGRHGAVAVLRDVRAARGGDDRRRGGEVDRVVAVATRAHDVNARHAGTDRYHVLAHRAHHPCHLLPRLALGLEQHQERSRLARIGALDDGLHARAGLLSCQAVLLQQRVEQLLHLRWHGSRAHVRN